MTPLQLRIIRAIAREPWSTALEVSKGLRTPVNTVRVTCLNLVLEGHLRVMSSRYTDGSNRTREVLSYAVAETCPVPSTRAARIRAALEEAPRTTRELAALLKEPGPHVRESLRELREAGGVVGTPCGGKAYLWALAA